eukprot:scaffold83_cov181-Amphora_coffeaeformis.AAC.3
MSRNTVMAFIPPRQILRVSRQSLSTVTLEGLSSNNNNKPDVSVRLFSTAKGYDNEMLDRAYNSGYSRPVVQWYPGHIAKAERQLKETFKAVDVVIEVRDARIAKATSHPMVGAWCAGRPRLVVLTHIDQVPSASLKAWKIAYENLGAEHPDQAEVLDGQILNQARQAERERAKYTMPEPKKKTSSSSSSGVGGVPVEAVLFVNAKLGAGVPALTRAIFRAGSHVQERRLRRGLKERPLRVGIIGYPNVGKSALINRLLGRRRARTANTPGVTRSLQWIRVKNSADKADGSTTTAGGAKEFELLDSPGIIPATLVDQSDATLLAACNCIGEAAYDNQAVASYLCEWLLGVYRLGYGRLAAPEWRKQAQKRYGFDPLKDIPTEESTLPNFDDFDDDKPLTRRRTGEDMLHEVADRTCQGDPEDAARKILQDFRQSRMGPICLQIAPSSTEDRGQRAVLQSPAEKAQEARQAREEVWQAEQAERAQKALEAANARGLELPPLVQRNEKSSQDNNEDGDKASSGKTNESEVGKGLFEGW